MKISKFLVTTGFAVLMTGGLFSVNLVPDEGLFDLGSVQSRLRAFNEADTEAVALALAAQFHKDRIALIEARDQLAELHAVSRGTSSDALTRTLPAVDGASATSGVIQQLRARVAEHREFTDPAAAVEHQLAIFQRNAHLLLTTYFSNTTGKLLSSKLTAAENAGKSSRTFEEEIATWAESAKGTVAAGLQAPASSKIGSVITFQNGITRDLTDSFRGFLLRTAGVNESGCCGGSSLGGKFFATHPDRQGHTSSTGSPFGNHTLKDVVAAFSNPLLWTEELPGSGGATPY